MESTEESCWWKIDYVGESSLPTSPPLPSASLSSSSSSLSLSLF